MIRARRSQPQKSGRQVAQNRAKLQKLAQAHPRLASRRLRNPFDVSKMRADGKLFAQHPRKAEVQNMVTHWTTPSYKNVQAARRANGAIPLGLINSFSGPDVPRALALQKLDAALATYMREFAPRAPQLPPKVRNVATGSATPSLYRGVRLTPPQLRDLLAGKYADKGYMAFSRDREYALDFVTRSDTPGTVFVLLRLSTANVQRGTPWLWYASKNDHRSNAMMRSKYDEMEVLLPPGRLLTRGTASPLRAPDGNDIVTQFDVAYEPDRAATALWNGKRLVK